MAAGFALWLFAVSMAASAFGGMLGMASGIFIVPLLTMFLHVEIHTAIGASIVSVIACSIGLFILLPVFRVLVMFVAFIGERDFRFAGIACLVLAIILLGMLLGVPAT